MDDLNMISHATNDRMGHDVRSGGPLALLVPPRTATGQDEFDVITQERVH
jgi:hypothetical protein